MKSENKTMCSTKENGLISQYLHLHRAGVWFIGKKASESTNKARVELSFLQQVSICLHDRNFPLLHYKEMQQSLCIRK